MLNAGIKFKLIHRLNAMEDIHNFIYGSREGNHGLILDHILVLMRKDGKTRPILLFYKQLKSKVIENA